MNCHPERRRGPRRAFFARWGASEGPASRLKQRAVIRHATLALATLTLLLAAFIPRTPVIANSTAKFRGAELFITTGCSHCHGPAGTGGEIGPSLINIRKRMNSAAITRQIHDGGQAMPAFGDQLTPTQIDDLVAYLRSQRKPPAAPPAN
jgi:mono/diheme cytochrome c family protein